MRVADAAEIVEAQKLRYETYVEEKAWGDKVDADHDTRTLPEDFDTHPASRLCLLGEDGRVDGAMRTTVWPAGEMPEARRWRWLSSARP